MSNKRKLHVSFSELKENMRLQNLAILEDLRDYLAERGIETTVMERKRIFLKVPLCLLRLSNQVGYNMYLIYEGWICLASIGFITDDIVHLYDPKYREKFHTYLLPLLI